MGKRATIEQRYPLFVCVVCFGAFCFFFLCTVFSCFHTTGCQAYFIFIFTTYGYGIFNVRTLNLGARAPCTSVTNKSALELIQKDRKVVPHPAPPGDRTQGLRIKNSDALTTEPRPPYVEVNYFDYLLALRTSGR